MPAPHPPAQDAPLECHLCGERVQLDARQSLRDALCPECGCMLWAGPISDLERSGRKPAAPAAPQAPARQAAAAQGTAKAAQPPRPAARPAPAPGKEVAAKPAARPRPAAAAPKPSPRPAPKAAPKPAPKAAPKASEVKPAEAEAPGEGFEMRESLSGLLGQEVRGYLIEKKLGAGAMGEVFLARQFKLKRSVAIKVLPPRWAGNKDFIERFVREAQSLAGIDHPSIIAVHDFFKHEGVFCIVMQYAGGGSVYQKMQRRGRLPEKRVAELIAQAALGLWYAAERGVVHRDIKPDNLLLSEEGHVKIADFGLVKMQEASVTTTGMVMGTPSFMAPEQIKDARKADHRSDLYSLGCTMYELLTGRPPFDSNNPMEVMRQHLQVRPRDISELGVSDRMARVVMRLLEKDPKDRFQTGQALADALAELSRSDPKAPALNVPRGPRPEKPARPPKPARPDKPEKPARPPKPARPQKPARPERAARPERPARPQKTARPEKPRQARAAAGPSQRPPPPAAGSEDPPTSRAETGLLYMILLGLLLGAGYLWRVPGEEFLRARGWWPAAWTGQLSGTPPADSLQPLLALPADSIQIPGLLLPTLAEAFAALNAALLEDDAVRQSRVLLGLFPDDQSHAQRWQRFKLQAGPELRLGSSSFELEPAQIEAGRATMQARWKYSLLYPELRQRLVVDAPLSAVLEQRNGSWVFLSLEVAEGSKQAVLEPWPEDGE